MNILVINGHDYTRWIEDDGYTWSRDAIPCQIALVKHLAQIRREFAAIELPGLLPVEVLVLHLERGRQRRYGNTDHLPLC